MNAAQQAARRAQMAIVGSGNARHKMCGTPTYRTWQHMRDRCARHPRYAGRGIIVCARWRSFEAFLEDMGARPEGMSLDRYPDRDGNYEPGNCRWASPKQQGNNTGTNVRIVHDGVERTVSEWADHFGVSYPRMLARLRRGLPMLEAASAPRPWVRRSGVERVGASL